MVPDKSDTIKLKIRLQPMYIRRLFATKAFILRIEIDKEDMDFRRNIQRPQLKFNWSFSPNIVVDEKSGRELIACTGDHCA